MSEVSFQPGRPSDSLDVLRIYAIASRVVCAEPTSMETVTQSLANMASHLVPPESLAAVDCQDLWRVFARVASHPKPFLRQEASKALYRDLDSIGQRLHLAPLPPWSQLPQEFSQSDTEDTQVEGLSLDAVSEEARRLHQGLGAGESLGGEQVLGLLERLHDADMTQLLGFLQSSGRVNRRELSMLERARATGHKLSSEDEILIEVLERVGVWLVQHTS